MSTNKFVSKNSLKTVLESLKEWLDIRTPFMNDGNKVIQANSNCESYNDSEVAVGKYNKSTSSTDKTQASLFTIGNGVSGARSNAFEVKQNGDIYVKKDGESVKLQDEIGVEIEVISIEEINNIVNG